MGRGRQGLESDRQGLVEVCAHQACVRRAAAGPPEAARLRPGRGGAPSCQCWAPAVFGPGTDAPALCFSKGERLSQDTTETPLPDAQADPRRRTSVPPLPRDGVGRRGGGTISGRLAASDQWSRFRRGVSGGGGKQRLPWWFRVSLSPRCCGPGPQVGGGGRPLGREARSWAGVREAQLHGGMGEPGCGRPSPGRAAHPVSLATGSAPGAAAVEEEEREGWGRGSSAARGPRRGGEDRPEQPGRPGGQRRTGKTGAPAAGPRGPRAGPPPLLFLSLVFLIFAALPGPPRAAFWMFVNEWMPPRAGGVARRPRRAGACVRWVKPRAGHISAAAARRPSPRGREGSRDVSFLTSFPAAAWSLAVRRFLHSFSTPPPLLT